MSAAALPVPLWAEILVSLLLLASAVFTLAAAIGLVRLQSFFQRMHPPALIYTGAAWCVTLASITYFSAQGHGLVLHVWVIIILLSITVPIATVLLARAALFRNRQERLAGTPLPLQPVVEPSLAEGEGADPQTWNGARQAPARQFIGHAVQARRLAYTARACAKARTFSPSFS